MAMNLGTQTVHTAATIFAAFGQQARQRAGWGSLSKDESETRSDL